MGKQLLDLSGQRFGRWTVLRFDRFGGEKPSRKAYWLCGCECGNQKSVWMWSLKAGVSTSCGCLFREGANHRTHGRTDTTEYTIWRGMMQRCRDPKAINYARYGGRGIKVCKRWHKFENFFADMGERPPNAQIDRKNNHLGYSPKNCRWITCKENNRNTRRSIRLTFNGETLTVPEWSDKVGLSQQIIHNRLRRHWSVEKTLTIQSLSPFSREILLHFPAR